MSALSLVSKLFFRFLVFEFFSSFSNYHILFLCSYFSVN
ncbi:hypothetical protein BVRB_9g217820 [Beta vulgaris subsp. vulgaris]|nr:hypothetical protein BVRB_9g217820 [Beta vulgaris subsp. vulgaris]